MEVTTTYARRLVMAVTLAAGLTGCATPAPQYPTFLDTLAGPPALVNAKNPAIQTAAKIKLDKCLKCEKIKALKYLGKVGCGCKGKEFKVSEALLAGLADCDKDVKMAAIKAIAKTICDGQCQVCDKTGCCDLPLSQKLYEMAYKYDDQGCPIEPDEEVRMAAAEVYCLCPLYQPGMPTQQVPEEPKPPEIEKPQDAPRPEAPPAPQAAAAAEEFSSAALQTTEPRHVSTAATPAQSYAEQPVAAAVAEPAPEIYETAGAVHMAAIPSRGVVRYIDSSYGTARVDFEGSAIVPRGTRLIVYHRYTIAGVTSAGQLEVISSAPGSATVRPVGTFRVNRLSSGDEVAVLGG